MAVLVEVSVKVLVGVGVGVLVEVFVKVFVGVGVLVGVFVGVSVKVKVTVGVFVNVGVKVRLLVGVLVHVAVKVEVGVGVFDGEFVAVLVGVEVNVGELKVPVEVAVGVAVGRRLSTYQASFRYPFPSHPAMTQSLLLKITLEWSDLGEKAAELVAMVQVEPSEEYQTSLANVPSFKVPPILNRRLSKTPPEASWRP